MKTKDSVSFRIIEMQSVDGDSATSQSCFGSTSNISSQYILSSNIVCDLVVAKITLFTQSTNCFDDNYKKNKGNTSLFQKHSVYLHRVLERVAQRHRLLHHRITTSKIKRAM